MEKPNDFLHREITLSREFRDCEGNPIPVKVHRIRTSLGFNHISLRVGPTTIEFSSDIIDYENAVREVARMLEQIADNPCLLPESNAPVLLRALEVITTLEGESTAEQDLLNALKDDMKAAAGIKPLIAGSLI